MSRFTRAGLHLQWAEPEKEGLEGSYVTKYSLRVEVVYKRPARRRGYILDISISKEFP